MKPELARQIARAIGTRPFEYQSCDPTYNAQRNLSGKTYYATPDTLKHFGARINHTDVEHEGLIFWIVESIPDGRGRASRFVAFDLFGAVLNSRDDTYSTTDRATAAFREWLAAFDVAAHYKAALAERAERAKREASDLAKASRAIRLPRKAVSQ